MRSSVLSASMPHPQLHSRDHYVRVTHSQFHRIVFEHLATVQEPDLLEELALEGLRAHSAGYTEWQAHTAGAAVSLGWDWLALDDGDVRLLRGVSPRTNLKLIDSSGYDLEDAAYAQALWHGIERIDWRAEVARSRRIQATSGGTPAGVLGADFS